MNKPTKPDAFSVLSELGTMPVTSGTQGIEVQPSEKLAALIPEKQSIWKPIILDEIIGADQRDWLSKTYDLLLNLGNTAELFGYALRHKSWLNTFLLAAGMSQIVEDYLFEPGMLGKATNLLTRLVPPLSASIVKFNAAVYRIKLALAGWIGGKRKATKWNLKLTQLVEVLAEIAYNPNNADLGEVDRILRLGEAVLSEVDGLPKSLRQEIIRLPSCFLSFDQQIEDLEHMLEDFSARWPDRDKPLLLVGVRTSGSYLGPLDLAILKTMGYRNVSLITGRPGKFITNQEVKAFNRLIREDGMALIVDDPPISGGTYYKTARMLEKAGLPHRNIVLLMQIFGDRSMLPTVLAKYQSIVLPLKDWNIQQFLNPLQVEKVLSDACAESMSIVEVNQIPSEDISDIRQHVHAFYQVKVIDNKTGTNTSHIILVKGIGLGYFAEHALAVSQTLSNYAPHLIALQHGLSFQDLGVNPQLLSQLKLLEEGKYSESIVEYVLVRNSLMSVPADTSLDVYGRNAVWEVASDMLGKIYGRGWWPARKAFIDDYVKNLSRSSKPSVIDGDIGVANWYLSDDGENSLLKAHLSERDFSHKDLYTYDPVYDLASLAQEVPSFEHNKRTRNLFETLAGEKVTAERWTLYQLVRLWDINRDNKYPGTSIARRMAKVVQEYFAEIYFNDLIPRVTGPICALDIDGVLETNPLGFASLTKRSARSLRALNKHGNRVLLATGRSLSELKDRCAAYHLAGGIAEYGAVLFDQTSGESLPILTDGEQATLNNLRGMLSAVKGIQVDTEYHFSVRAYITGVSGERRGLNDETITNILNSFKDLVYAIKGVAQTDFMVTRIDKRVGLEQWLLHFDQASQLEKAESVDGKPLALAVGDSWTDVPMFAIASQAFAPAHADIKQSDIAYRKTSKPYERGLEQAVGIFIGHKPGLCPTCQPPALQPESEFMLDILSAQENRISSMLRQTFRHYTRKVSTLRVGTK